MPSELNPTYLATLIVSILVSLSLHEAMHAYTGYKLGDTTAKDEGRVSFNPLRHIDPFMTLLLPLITLIIFHVPVLAAKPVPFNPSRVKWDEFGAALIALAGPLTNLVLAIAAAVVLRFVPGAGIVNQALSIFLTLNVGLFVFNMIPIPPLDGSRVLYAFSPAPLQRLLEQVDPFGLIVVFGLVVFGGLSQLLVYLNNSVLQLIT